MGRIKYISLRDYLTFSFESLNEDWNLLGFDKVHVVQQRADKDEKNDSANATNSDDRKECRDAVNERRLRCGEEQHDMTSADQQSSEKDSCNDAVNGKRLEEEKDTWNDSINNRRPGASIGRERLANIKKPSRYLPVIYKDLVSLIRCLFFSLSST